MQSDKTDGKEEFMLEHPEIGWIERTGYPSWLQEQPRSKEEEEWEKQDRNGN